MQVSTTAKGHQSKESPSNSLSHNGTTTLIYTNMRTQPQSESTANLTTPQMKNITQLASTKTTTNQKSEGAASQGAVSTTSSQQTAEIKPSKSTTKQKSTAGKCQNQFGFHGICSFMVVLENNGCIDDEQVIGMKWNYECSWCLTGKLGIKLKGMREQTEEKREREMKRGVCRKETGQTQGENMHRRRRKQRMEESKTARKEKRTKGLLIDTITKSGWFVNGNTEEKGGGSRGSSESDVKQMDKLGARKGGDKCKKVVQ